MRRFTNDELETLTSIATNGGKVDNRFETARGRNGWVRGLSSTDSMKIFNIYKDATGVKRSFYPNCGWCVLQMLKEVGVKYFADLEALKEETNPVEPKPKKKPAKKKQE